jgi:hypothetical protein
MAACTAKGFNDKDTAAIENALQQLYTVPESLFDISVNKDGWFVEVQLSHRKERLRHCLELDPTEDPEALHFSWVAQVLEFVRADVA